MDMSFLLFEEEEKQKEKEEEECDVSRISRSMSTYTKI